MKYFMAIPLIIICCLIVIIIGSVLYGAFQHRDYWIVALILLIIWGAVSHAYFLFKERSK